MSVLLSTTLGDIVIDLFTQECPIACTNFLKLCKLKYYNNVLFFNVQENFMIQTGDPTGTGKGGDSMYGQLCGAQAHFFQDEFHSNLKHNRKGTVAMANTGPNTNTSQFYITTSHENLEYLDGKHTIFGHVAEGIEIIDKINELFVDKDYRPYQDVRILHTYILDDPFPDPKNFQAPASSPARDRPEEESVPVRVAADEEPEDGRTAEEIEKSVRAKEAKSRAVVLEMIGDIPDADIKPPEEVLFVCKLNPVTESSDLDMAFCRFGACKSEVIRDYKTGDSLCYAFVEFTEKKHCEEAYFKMNNVLLDDRRIKVDFSQSVSKLWNQFSRKNKKGQVADEKSSSQSRKSGLGELQLKIRPSQQQFDLVFEDEPESSHKKKKFKKEGRQYEHKIRKRSRSRDTSRSKRHSSRDRRSKHRHTCDSQSRRS